MLKKELNITMIRYSVFLLLLISIYSCCEKSPNMIHYITIKNKSKQDLVYNQGVFDTKNIESNVFKVIESYSIEVSNHSFYELIRYYWGNSEYDVTLFMDDTVLVKWSDDFVHEQSNNEYNELCKEYKYNFFCDNNWTFKVIQQDEEVEYSYTITDEMVEYWKAQANNTK